MAGVLLEYRLGLGQLPLFYFNSILYAIEAYT